MNMRECTRLNIDIEKLLSDCDNAQVQAEQVAEFNAKVMAKKAYQKAYKEAHRERYNELGRKYYVEHIDERRAYARKKYYERRGQRIENPIAYKAMTSEEAHQAEIERHRRYRDTHRDEIRKKGRDYYNVRKDNPEFIAHRRALERARYAKNQEKMLAKNRAYRARKRAEKLAQQQTENKDT